MLKVLFSLACALPLVIASAELPENSVTAKYQYYEDNNGVYVQQPLVNASQRVGLGTAVNAHFLIDGITAASRRIRFPLLDTLNALSSGQIKNVRTGEIFSVDGVTSASQKEIRQEYGLGATHVWKNTLLSMNAAKSDENDYHSRSVGGDARIDLFGENTNIIGSATRFYDDYKPIQNNNGMGGARLVNSATFGLTQTLSPRTIANISLARTWSYGFLGRPYYQVLVEDTAGGGGGGTFYLESYPSQRDIYAAVFQFRQHYPSFIREGSAQAEYRWCTDNWGLHSGTYSLLVNQYLHRDFILEIRYRYYVQSAVAFYRDRYTLRNVNPNSSDFLSYLTVDPRLADFDDHLICAKLIFLLKDFFKPETEGLLAFFPTRLDLEVERYLRATDPDPVVRRRRYEYYGDEGLRAWLVRAGMAFNY